MATSRKHLRRPSPVRFLPKYVVPCDLLAPRRVTGDFRCRLAAPVGNAARRERRTLSRRAADFGPTDESETRQWSKPVSALSNAHLVPDADAMTNLRLSSLSHLLSARTCDYFDRDLSYEMHLEASVIITVD